MQLLLVTSNTPLNTSRFATYTLIHVLQVLASLELPTQTFPISTCTFSCLTNSLQHFFKCTSMDKLKGTGQCWSEIGRILQNYLKYVCLVQSLDIYVYISTVTNYNITLSQTLTVAPSAFIFFDMPSNLFSELDRTSIYAVTPKKKHLVTRSAAEIAQTIILFIHRLLQFCFAFNPFVSHVCLQADFSS